MLTFERTYDAELIRSAICHPKVWPFVSDDFSPAREEWKPAVENPTIEYIAVRDGEEFVGIFALVVISPILREIHTALLPSAWGERARAAAKGIVMWLWANTPCRRLITSVPAYNRLALRFAKAAGMSIYGLNHKSYLHRGQLTDQILLGLSKPAE